MVTMTTTHYVELCTVLVRTQYQAVGMSNECISWHGQPMCYSSQQEYLDQVKNFIENWQEQGFLIKDITAEEAIDLIFREENER